MIGWLVTEVLQVPLLWNKSYWALSQWGAQTSVPVRHSKNLSHILLQDIPVSLVELSCESHQDPEPYADWKRARVPGELLGARGLIPSAPLPGVSPDSLGGCPWEPHQRASHYKDPRRTPWPPPRHHHTSVVVERQDVISLGPRPAEEEPCILLILLEALEFWSGRSVSSARPGRVRCGSAEFVLFLLLTSRPGDWKRLSLWRAALWCSNTALLSLAFLRPTARK